jgi:hypothetical protein
VGGTKSRHFAGINTKPRKLLQIAPTPTTLVPAHFAGDRLHIIPVLVRDAVLGKLDECNTRLLEKGITVNLSKFYG